MKKIGIITYHFARNYGAVLQCYALQSFLEHKGYEVVVFDYVSEKQFKNNDYIKHGNNLKAIIMNACLLPFIKYRKTKNHRFDDFNKLYLKLSPHLESIDELQQYIKNNEFDYVISGSDQVFNPNIDDFEEAFLFPFETNAKKISYAASTGNATARDIERIITYINQFEKKSIREEQDIVKFPETMRKDISVVCDPVMLLDSAFWSKIVKKQQAKPYLACYFLHKDLFGAEFAAAQKIANALHLEIRIVNARFSSKSLKRNTIFDAGPREFVELIANADYICTDSFHGTLFSLLFNKHFSCFDTKANINDSRRRNLLEGVNALEAYQYIENTVDPITDLDYMLINKNIEQIRNESIRFLENMNDR